MSQNVVNLLLFIINLLSKNCMTELMKSINTLFTNLIWRDLSREKQKNTKNNSKCYIMQQSRLSYIC